MLRISDGHPFDLIMKKADETLHVRIYVWNVTHGGATRAGDEYRIQVTGVVPPLQGPVGFQTLILGWHDDLSVVAAFDPERHRDQTGASSPSIQIGYGVLQDAANEEALRTHERGNEEIAVAFPPELLLAYIKEQAGIHAFGSVPAELGALEAAGEGQDVEDNVAPARRRIVRTLTSQYRDASFRKRVLAAYDNQCAMCGVQLGLVEAAHIVPVGAAGSTDETSNGMALCSLHHEAYDQGLVHVDRHYNVHVADSLLESLRSESLVQGEEDFTKNLYDSIILPTRVDERPLPDYLEIGMRMRRRDG